MVPGGDRDPMRPSFADVVHWVEGSDRGLIEENGMREREREKDVAEAAGTGCEGS